ncbi:DUF1642 domain-containing protein [Enterococcus thailandicus]|uniref:DUF1642 domain-containing protein n=1 Tax=Enterococcus thailandicus TaxID=417368 RepID=UPI003B5A0CE0
MNKQELIEKIKKAVKNEISLGNYYREVNGYGYGAIDYEPYDEDDAQSVANDIILELQEDLEQLDEPRKSVVPKCAEQFLEIAQSSTDVIQLFDSIIYATESDGLILEKWGWSVDFYNWLAKDSDTLYILCDALRYGYEVEKEPLYVMPIPHVSFPVHYCVEDDHISFRQGNAQKFTQAELDKYFPDIKQFAVPVEEVEEG